MATPRRQIHYVPSTHWDREWYLPFQGFRYKLVKVVDRLLEILEADPEYRCFVFDGQTVALHDYLEIMPANRDRLRALIQAGRILVGPWYTMPDERILSGEALIRNLLRGYADARAWGVEPMRYGYVCDIFGHIAQMPQLFCGMGIPHALVWRGANDAHHPSLFRWRAPDGSEVVVWRPSDDGAYSSGKPVWEAAGAPDPGSPAWRAGVVAAADHVHRLEGSRSAVPVELWLDGQDHQVPGAQIPRALDAIRQHMPEAEVLHSSLPEFAAAVDPYRETLPVVAGELIEPARDASRWLAVIPHCLSSHYPMKQANDRCQTLLEAWVEPYHVWAALVASAPPSGFLDHAWQYLLQNHPHDSICGCSIDQVHKDTEYRYDQCEIICAHVLRDCQLRVASAPLPVPPQPMERRPPGQPSPNGSPPLDSPSPSPSAEQPQAEVSPDRQPVPEPQPVPDQQRAPDQKPATDPPLTDAAPSSAPAVDSDPGHVVSVFSAHAHRRQRVVTLEFDYPRDLPARQLHGFPDDLIPCFDLVDARGRHVDYQLHGYVADVGEQEPRAILEGGLRAHYRVRASVETTLDGIGYASFRVQPRQRPYRSMGSQRCGATTAENEHLRVQIQDNGAVTVHDKASGATYRDLCLLEDTADVGDGWYHVRPVDNQTFLSSGFPAGISVLTDGDLVTTFRVEQALLLPAAFDWLGRRRAAARVPLRVALDVTLRKGARHVECELQVDNTVRDHRLRALFPTGVGGTDWFSGQPFTVVRRPRGVDRRTGDWQEAEVAEKSFVALAGVHDGNAGLALLAGHGLHEVAVPDDASGTMALTLLRGFKRHVQHGELATAAPMDRRTQLLGPLRWTWSLVPLAGPLDVHALWRHAQELQTGWLTRLYQGVARDATLVRVAAGPLLVSALKPAQDGAGVILRVFNPADAAVSGTLEFGVPVCTAIEVNHAEEPLAEARESQPGSQLRVELPPQRLRTYRLRFA